MRLVTIITFKNDKPVFPPPYTRLSDELVYLATKFLTTKVRGKDYPYDFLDKGDIRPDRVPSGVGPLVWAHGLPHFPVYKGYYILCGRKHAKWVGWIMNSPGPLTKKYPMWTIGAVVAPESALGLPRTPRITERQLRVHKPRHTRDVENGSEKAPGAHDVVQKVHFDLSIVPRNSSGGYQLVPICQIPGYRIRVGPNWVNGRPAEMVNQEMFSAHGMESFDYAKALQKLYSNQMRPQAEKDGLYMADGDVDVEMSGVNRTTEDDSDISDAADYDDYFGKEDFDYRDDESLEEEEDEDFSDEMGSSAVSDEVYQMTWQDLFGPGEDTDMSDLSPPSKKAVQATKSPTKANKSPTKVIKFAMSNKPKTTTRYSKATKRVTRSHGAKKSMKKTAAVVQTGVDKNLAAFKEKVAKETVKNKPKQSTPQPIAQNTDERKLIPTTDEIIKINEKGVTEIESSQPGQKPVTRNENDSNIDSVPDQTLEVSEEAINVESKQSTQESISHSWDASNTFFDSIDSQKIMIEEASSESVEQTNEEEIHRKAIYLAEIATDAIKERDPCLVKLELQEIKAKATELSNFVQEAFRGRTRTRA